MKLFLREDRTEGMYYNADSYVVFGKSTSSTERISWYVLLNLPFIKKVTDYIDCKTFYKMRGETYLRILVSLGAHWRFIAEWFPFPRRQLTGTWTLEPIDDLETLHGLDVEQELINILSDEINRSRTS